MIRVLTTASHRFTIDRYLASWGMRFLLRIQPLAYEQALSRGALRGGVHLFTDMDRLSEEARRAAAALWEQLRRCYGPGAVLNHPTESLRRFELLATLHARGLNAFGVHRVQDDPGAMRFPVFLRAADDHRGNRTPPLRSRAELAEAVHRLETLGASFNDWMVVEFCDTADRHGLYRKYSAFRIGSRIIPRHLFTGRAWCLKQSESVEPEHCREELAYLEANPHREALLRLFELARIEYGRIDYSLLDGRIQAWEINTNPMLPWHGNREETARLAAHRRFAEQLAGAWEELDGIHPASLIYPAEWVKTVGRVSREILRNAGLIRGHGFPPDLVPALSL